MAISKVPASKAKFGKWDFAKYAGIAIALYGVLRFTPVLRAFLYGPREPYFVSDFFGGLNFIGFGAILFLIARRKGKGVI